MERRLILPTSMVEKLDRAALDSKTRNVWENCGMHSRDDVLQRALGELNRRCVKLNLIRCELWDKSRIKAAIGYTGKVSESFGIILNGSEDPQETSEAGDKRQREVIVAYVFLIPPNYDGRSTVLAQQVIPTLANIRASLLESTPDKQLSNRPIFGVNFNELPVTKAIAVNFISAEILDMRCVDVFCRDMKAIDGSATDGSAGMSVQVKTLRDYDQLIRESSKGGQDNEIFELSHADPAIKFLTTRLKDGIHVNNEPYWYTLKAYAALTLAVREGYRVDLSQIDRLERGNPSLDAFRTYAERFVR